MNTWLCSMHRRYSSLSESPAKTNSHSMDDLPSASLGAKLRGLPQFRD